MVLAPDGRRTGRNAHWISCPVVDDERIRVGHWLESVFCDSFSALTLLAV